MRDLNRALSDVAFMREQLARVSEFRGFGPRTLTFTGLLALAVAATQGLWLKAPAAHVNQFIAVWYATALASIAVIGVEAVIRARAQHGSLALAHLQQAVRRFCPALVAGALLTVALSHTLPQDAWLLPGLWEIIFSLGAFATASMLPRPMFAVGIWYLLCGLVEIQRGPVDPLSGWTMGIPFGVGQLMVAAVLLGARRDAPAAEL